jgi:hypothetical protein
MRIVANDTRMAVSESSTTCPTCIGPIIRSFSASIVVDGHSPGRQQDHAMRIFVDIAVKPQTVRPRSHYEIVPCAESVARAFRLAINFS